MADHELLSAQNLNCEVTTSNISFDFGDTSRFRKIEFPEQTGLTANSLLQLPPVAAVSDAATKTYILKFPEGVQGTLLHLRQGGYATTMVDTASHFSGTASLHPIDPASVAVFNTFTIASFVIGQYFLSDISSKMSEINRKLDAVLSFLEDSKRTELLSELTFVKYAVGNYYTIMLSEPQRIATLTNIQRSKIRAIADIDFYTTELERRVNAKDAKKNPQTVLNAKQNLDLASQLYAISSIMEPYYAQNWNGSYLKSICAEADLLLGHTKNKISDAISPYAKDIREAHKETLLKKNPVPFTSSEEKVLKISDTLTNQVRNPLVVTIENALHEPMSPSELYLAHDGSIYQKL